MTTMQTTWKQTKRRLVDVDEVGKWEEIARRWNAGQTESAQGQATESTNKHSR